MLKSSGGFNKPPFLFSVGFKSPRKELADEIRCPYNQLNRIYDFIKSHPEKRYLLELPDDDSLKYDKLIQQLSYLENYTISTGKISLLISLLDSNYNAFLKYPVADWETFSDLQRLGVSDIYIDGPLGFQTKTLTKGKGTTKIRVSPTISPNSLTISPQSFYIRPEDLHLYADSIDVIDFKVTGVDKETALFDIYSRESCIYNIDQLINGLPSNVKNSLIPEKFAQKRLNCGQRCKVPSSSNCGFCNTCFDLSREIYKLAKNK